MQGKIPALEMKRLMKLSEMLRVLVTERRIRAKVKELGEKISNDYRGRNLTVILISNGSLIFAADLVRNLSIPIHLDSISSHSYHGSESSGKVRIISRMKLDIKGRNILIVDDIADTGMTITKIIRHMEKHSPAEIKTCTLLDKPSRRKVPFTPDYSGFTIPDRFVVGYGLDYDEYFRNLPYIGYFK